VLDRYVFCSPCFLEECPYEHQCMTEITVEMALKACEELLATTRPGQAAPFSTSS
jgi:ADP-heptose:LPS heptosyltransferase